MGSIVDNKTSFVFQEKDLAPVAESLLPVAMMTSVIENNLTDPLAGKQRNELLQLVETLPIVSLCHSAKDASIAFIEPRDLVEIAVQKSIVVNTLVPVIAAAATTCAETKCQANNGSNHEEHSVGDILKKNPVHYIGGAATDPDAIMKSIDSLSALIQKISQVSDRGIAVSPGFETKFSADIWKRNGSLYETLPDVNALKGSIPLPSSEKAIKYYTEIQKVWQNRMNWAESTTKSNFCSCISTWEHNSGDILAFLANQVMEQSMIQEASSMVTDRMKQPGFTKGDVWDQNYLPELCPTPEEMDHCYEAEIPICILGGRNKCIENFLQLAFEAKSSIEISTCYLFSYDPAQRYTLLNFLPYIAREHGVKIRLLCDMMPIESLALKGALIAEQPAGNRKKNCVGRGGVSPLSFLEALPKSAPPISDSASNNPHSILSYLEELLEVASSIPGNGFEIRWWCARDAQDKYRIKNHAKCIVIDREIAFMGGSNMFPTPESGNSDLDLLVGGKMVEHIAGTFNHLWQMMEPETNKIADIFSVSSSTNTKKHNICWSDASTKVAFLRSEPSSSGEDIILRHILGAIKTAKKSVFMCMGHSNKPKALALALNEACKRGVTVRLLVNSLYSCDIRVNQRDLFLSLKELLTIAPEVEVYTTALPSQRAETNNEEKKEAELENESGPPFLHSKYTVIDSKWIAVGSWNVWTRSAFFEIEHELLIYSEKLAKKLEEKFMTEMTQTSTLIKSPNECGFWCPSGCNLCQPFGPFYL